MDPAINPRKKPKQERARATYEAILEAAARILVRGGLDALNTNRVAEVAGVSIGTLYQYFPTKQAILTEIIREKRKLLLDDLRVASDNMKNETFDETLDKLLSAAIAHQLRWPKLARILEFAEAFLPLEAETNELNLAIHDVVADFLTHAGHPEPDQNARDLVSALRGLIDAAGLAGETDSAALFTRVKKLATGFLAHDQ
ncbi:TetR family transcriptional regulator [Shimia isoporae]|uniref:TetR family transcriptional regulator n=1 Tax=Shimia isoporae TaxID=647720 RepID=A0A4R1N149_9RHOB|nr:TetR/AcrR family transcriptional regulator [Shimia isoporae]TCK99757.1 TetR family transcriptional regulator [Shimia isoporae]